MASVRTEITELATGLGMLGFDSPAEAIRRLPKQLVDVDEAVWKKFVSAVDEPSAMARFSWKRRTAFAVGLHYSSSGKVAIEALATINFPST